MKVQWIRDKMLGTKARLDDSREREAFNPINNETDKKKMSAETVKSDELEMLELINSKMDFLVDGFLNEQYAPEKPSNEQPKEELQILELINSKMNFLMMELLNKKYAPEKPSNEQPKEELFGNPDVGFITSASEVEETLEENEEENLSRKKKLKEELFGSLDVSFVSTALGFSTSALEVKETLDENEEENLSSNEQIKEELFGNTDDSEEENLFYLLDIDEFNTSSVSNKSKEAKSKEDYIVKAIIKYFKARELYYNEPFDFKDLSSSLSIDGVSHIFSMVYIDLSDIEERISYNLTSNSVFREVDKGILLQPIANFTKCEDLCRNIKKNPNYSFIVKKTLGVDYEFIKLSLEIFDSLATSMHSISPDWREYSFIVSQGVYFWLKKYSDDAMTVVRLRDIRATYRLFRNTDTETYTEVFTYFSGLRKDDDFAEASIFFSDALVYQYPSLANELGVMSSTDKEKISFLFDAKRHFDMMEECGVLIH